MVRPKILINGENMSIVRCEECEKTIDTDAEEAFILEDNEKFLGWICNHCYEDEANHGL